MRKRVLVVDDEPGIVEEIEIFLEEEGFEVFTADSAKDGIALLMKTKPDLLILDMKLPDMSGIEVLKVSKEKSPRTKVIVNTGYVDQNVIDEAARLGRDAFMQKPFNLLALKEEIDRVLGTQ